MKIFALHNYDTVFKNRLNYENKNRNNQDIENLQQGISSTEILENYNSAKIYYNKKLDNDRKLFDDEASFFNVLENPKARTVLFTFFRERAQQELLELNSKTNLTEDEKNKKEGLKEIIKAFPSSDQAIKANRIPNSVAFCGILTPEQKKKCHIAIHTASAACGTISATMGEGAAIGGDTAFLRGTQALMFLYLQN